MAKQFSAHPTFSFYSDYLFGKITWIPVSSVVCSITVLITTARSTLKIEAANLFETLLNFCHTGCSHIPEGINLPRPIQFNSIIWKHEKLGSHFLFQGSKHYLIYRIEFWYIKAQHLHFCLHVSAAAGKLNFLPWKWITSSQETFTWVSNFSFSTHSSSVSGWASSILRCSSFWILDASDPNSGFLGTCKRMFHSAL